MHKEAKEGLGVRLKPAVIEYADHFGVTEACRESDVPRSSFYRWKKKNSTEGRSGLYRNDPSPIAIPAEPSRKWWRKSCPSGRSINWVL